MGAPVPDIPRPAPRQALGPRLRERCRGFVTWMGPARLVGGAAVVVATAVGGWWLLHAPPPAVERSLPVTTRVDPATSVPGGTTPAAPGSTAPAAGERIVHVAGAVTRPGLVRVAAGARVNDAITAAGGPLPEADLDALNLAAPVVDGSRIYVPEEGEVVPGAAVAGAGAAASAGPAALVDVNTATAADLDALPGIGPSTAQAIVAHRDAHGPFRSVDDLLDVRGIGPSKLEQFRALVTV